MQGWSFVEVERIMRGRWINEPAHTGELCPFNGVAIDTRSIEPGQFFFAFVGEQVDGHEFVQTAIDAGAAVCVVSDAGKITGELGVPVLAVDDVLDAMTDLAQAWREKLNAKVIAITGSNGKTTTCRMVHAVCEQQGKASCSIKSFNNAIGVPMTILNTPIDAEYLIAEVGTSSHGEVDARTGLLKPDVSVIVSIGRAHLEELGGVDGVSREKSAIVRAMPMGGTAIVPTGVVSLDAELDGIEDRTILRLDVAKQIHIETDAGHSGSTRFLFDDELFTVPMLGKHSASNAAMTIMVARVLGIDDKSIRQGLANVSGPPMRFERVEIGKRIVYNDAYNANPDSMRASLETFDQINADSIKIAVLGEMLELGEQSDLAHRSLIESFKAYPSIDRFILVGNEFARIRADSSIISFVPICDVQSMGTIAEMIESDAVVLLKGSRGVGLERIVYTLQRQAHTH